MKKQTGIQKLFLLPLLLITAFSSHAQEFTLTTTKANVSGYRALIDEPGLSGNPVAIVLVTPLGNSATLNPHPIGAYYNMAKWWIMNLDQKDFTPGLSYKIQYWLAPGANQFMHQIASKNMGSDGSFIDNPALNNNPNAQFKIFQNWAPEIRGGLFNRYETKAGYSSAAGKWYIANVNNERLELTSAYNIVISSEGSVGVATNTANNSSIDACDCPASLPPNGNAGGDLTGTYPNPTIQKIMGRPLSNTAPGTGQVLKWNGTEWTPSDVSVSTGNSTTYTAGAGLILTGTEFNTQYNTAIWNASKLVDRDIMTTAPAVGQVLKWGGGSWYPADDNVAITITTTTPPTATMQTFFKNTYETSPSLGNNAVYFFANHSYPVTVTKNSRLIISGNFYLSSDGCFGCKSTKFMIDLMVNGGFKALLSTVEIANGANITTSVSNYMLDFTPGTYVIQFRASHPWIDGNIPGKASATFSSIIVVPL